MDKKMFAALIHFGDLWDWANKYGQNGLESFRFDMEVWNNVVNKCVEHQVDTIVFDISEGLIHEEYPEINFPGAWTNDQLRAEVQRLKKLGITMIPKYNFAVPHASWLGVYNEHKISTPKYYEICKHVIEEAYEIFDHPAYIHLGFDEESPDRRTPDNFQRDKEMLFHDYKYIVDCVKATGARPCVWHSMFLYFDDTFEIFDKDVVVFTCMYYTYDREDWTPLETQPENAVKYYHGEFKQRWFYPDYVAKYGDVPVEYVEQDPVIDRVLKKRQELYEKGYKMVMATTNMFIKNNEWVTLKKYKGHEHEDAILGYVACPWRATVKDWEEVLLEEIELMGKARKEFYPETLK